MVHALVHTIQRNLNIAFLATFYILHPATDLSNLSRSPHPPYPRRWSSDMRSTLELEMKVREDFTIT